MGYVRCSLRLAFVDDKPAKLLSVHCPRASPVSLFLHTHPLQDHAAAGLGAGVAAVLCMHPLDLLKIQLQVSTSKPQGGIGKQIWYSLRDIHAGQGWKGLYRGVVPNIAGNASSWGLYFLLSVP